MKVMQQQSTEWLKAHVSIRFWDLWLNKMHDINMEQRAIIMDHNLRNGLNLGKSFMKWVSYSGAVRPLPNVVLAKPDHIDPDGQTYMECGNEVYAHVMLLVWPDIPRDFGISNQKTIGDMLESVLGYHWALRILEPAGPHALREEFTCHLERVCFCAFFTWTDVN